jgi:hypothetical protein
MSEYGFSNYAIMLGTGLFASAITVMALGSRRNFARSTMKVYSKPGPRLPDNLLTCDNSRNWYSFE